MWPSGTRSAQLAKLNAESQHHRHVTSAKTRARCVKPTQRPNTVLYASLRVRTRRTSAGTPSLTKLRYHSHEIHSRAFGDRTASSHAKTAKRSGPWMNGPME